MSSFNFYRYLDSHPFTGKRKTDFQARLSTKTWLDKYFDGTPNCDQVTGVTRGKIYTITAVEGFGDCSDWTFTDDNGNEMHLGDFFFDEPEETDKPEQNKT